MHDFSVTVGEGGAEWAKATFTTGVDAAREARTLLPDLLDGLCVESVRLGDMELLLSELVTNASIHAHSPEVRVAVRRGDPLRVCVSDSGPGDPSIGHPDLGGWGLRLVERLSLTWGVIPLDIGKVVWFDIPLGT